MIDEQNQPEADEVTEINEEVDDLGQDTTDWKALALKNQGIAQRLKTKLEKAKEVKAEAEPAKPEKSNELDYGQRAFLKTYGISGADELSLVKSWTERTGDQIDVLVDDEIFNAKLKGLRDQKAAKETLQSMSNSRNAQPSSKSKAEFWMDKPFDEVPKEFKQEVLKAKLDQEKEGGKFTDQPVVYG
jgi:hypothetical protein